MTNTELATIGLDTPTVTLPDAIAVRVGKGTKQVRYFAEGGAKEIKAALKARNPKLSGKAISRMVNDVLCGQKTLRTQLAHCFVTACVDNGMVPDRGETTKNGARLVFVNAAPKVVEVQTEAIDYENLSIDEINDVIFKLQSIIETRCPDGVIDVDHK